MMYGSDGRLAPAYNLTLSNLTPSTSRYDQHARLPPIRYSQLLFGNAIAPTNNTIEAAAHAPMQHIEEQYDSSGHHLVIN
jgi:hypothetical protein